MDEIRQLENQIAQLQKELENQKSEAARLRQKLSDDNLKRLQDYKAQMEKNLDQHDKKVQKEYERLLREYQKSADQEIQEQQLRMDTEYQKLLASMRQKEQEWNEKSRQLENLISQLKETASDNDQKKAIEANSYMADTAVVYKEIEKKPHEKFFPKRLQNFYNTIQEARTLHKSGLYEAATAISVSTRSGLNRLGYEVDEQYEEWKRQYYIFKNDVELMRFKLNNELNEWKNFVEINFWSRGEYESQNKRITELEREISKVEEMGLDDYVKNESSLSTDDLKKYIDELDNMSKSFENRAMVYKQRYQASCERSDWGEMIIDFLENEINLTWVESESHFKLVENEGSEFLEYMKMKYPDNDIYEKEDMREWLELAFDNATGSRIYVYILPYEKDNHVENRLVVYIDYNGAVNEAYSRQIYLHIRESIGLKEEDGIINFATDVNQLTTNSNSILRETGQSLEKKIKMTH